MNSLKLRQTEVSFDSKDLELYTSFLSTQLKIAAYWTQCNNEVQVGLTVWFKSKYKQKYIVACNVKRHAVEKEYLAARSLESMYPWLPKFESIYWFCTNFKLSLASIKHECVIWVELIHLVLPIVQWRKSRFSINILNRVYLNI